ncbi:MAG: hypothetical protein JWL90_2916 [Chthoniobacteraceae bacterium]|nr:hypothetical protein [Chthoniobacteraceae bacterium]
MKPKNNKRDGHAAKLSEDKPAIFEPLNGEPPAPPAGFAPAAVVERLRVWSLKGRDRYFQMPASEDGHVSSWSESDLKRELRIAGISSRAMDGKTASHMDLVVSCLQRERSIDYAGPMSGKPIQVYNDAQGRRLLVDSSFRLIQPRAGDWSMLRGILERMLKTPETDQTEYLYAWLKVALEALIAGETRPGHALILAGPSNCGKSFVQEHVLTPLLGGRAADPTRYLTGETGFNSELCGSEHLAIQELTSAQDHKSRALFAEGLKRLLVTESHPLNAKYCNTITFFPWLRVSLSINDSVDRLRALPPLSSDFGDKVILLLCQSHPMPMETNTTAERIAFRAALDAELPGFVEFLLSWEIPEGLRLSKHAARFGHDNFHHPELSTALFEQEPQNVLLQILDHSVALYRDGAWGWGSSEELKEELCIGSMGPRAAKLFSFSGSCGTLLSKLKERFPDRFLSKHTNKGNRWQIYPPKD